MLTQLEDFNRKKSDDDDDDTGDYNKEYMQSFEGKKR